MLSRFTYFVNVSCSCAASISSVLLHRQKKEHQLNLSAETLTMLFLESAGLWIVISIFFEPSLFFHPVNNLSMVSIGSCLLDTKSGGAHRSALDRPWLPNKSFVHFSLSLLNSFIYLPHVLSFAKSRINNVCVSFPRRLSCNNRSEDFRATLAEFRAQYWGEIVGAGFVESGKTLLRSIGKKWEGNL